MASIGRAEAVRGTVDRAQARQARKSNPLASTTGQIFAPSPDTHSVARRFKFNTQKKSEEANRKRARTI